MFIYNIYVYRERKREGDGTNYLIDRQTNFKVKI